MKRFALLGETLGHSLSPALHKAIYRQLEIDDASYRVVELEAHQLSSFFTGFRVGGFDGVNITLPHKATVIPMLDEVDSKAKLINAVNCINRVNNKLTGYNTDLLGFAYSLRQQGVNIEDKTFAVLGAGGGAQAVAAVLAEGNAKEIFILNRSAERAASVKENIEKLNADVVASIVSDKEFSDHAKSVDVIVNTTSLGMSPDTKETPINKSVFHSNMLAFDIVYNPRQTRFLKEAQTQGAATANGIQMLVAQAVFSVEIWMGGNIVTHIDMNALTRDIEKVLK